VLVKTAAGVSENIEYVRYQLRNLAAVGLWHGILEPPKDVDRIYVGVLTKHRGEFGCWRAAKEYEMTRVEDGRMIFDSLSNMCALDRIDKKTYFAEKGR